MSWRRRRRRFPAVRAALCAALLATPGHAGGAGRLVAVGDAGRLVAVGDVHGAYDAAAAILREAGIVDADGHWAGGEATFVQTGDFLDRGADSLRVAFWLMALQEEARAAGGEALVLLGNHEVMNLTGDRNYVTAEMVAPKVDKESEKRRRKMCKERVELIKERLKAMDRESPPSYALREACLAEHPPGMIEHVADLGPDGRLGKWLRTLPTMVRRGDTIFVHGGISPELAGRSPAEVNRTVREELADFDRFRGWLVAQGEIVPAASLGFLGFAVQEILQREEGTYPDGLKRLFEIGTWSLLREDGPFWFRGYADWSDEEGAAEMPAILAGHGAKHVVVGHSPRESGKIESRFDGRVFLIDSGMLTEFYGGQPAALEIVGGRVEAIYLDKRVTLYDPE